MYSFGYMIIIMVGFFLSQSLPEDLKDQQEKMEYLFKTLDS